LKDLIILFCLLTILSCHTRKNKIKENETEQPVYSQPGKPNLTRLDSWLSFHELAITDFDTLGEDKATFQFMGIQDIRNIELHKEFFIYLPDSSKYIDLDSYSLILEKSNGKLKSLGSEPDTEVAVVNLKDSTRTRILFCGPACIPEEALWDEENNVYVLGLSDETGKEYLPFIHIYDLSKRSVLRLYTKKAGRHPNNYIAKVRMANVKFD
jgi:hypothetical protein